MRTIITLPLPLLLVRLLLIPIEAHAETIIVCELDMAHTTATPALPFDMSSEPNISITIQIDTSTKTATVGDGKCELMENSKARFVVECSRRRDSSTYRIDRHSGQLSAESVYSDKHHTSIVTPGKCQPSRGKLF